MENYMGFKIEQLAQRAVESIKDEWEKQDDQSTWDHERCIHETIDSLTPDANWELIEFLADDTDLGWESDIHTLDNQDNIFTFLRGRIFEEIEQKVLYDTQGWFDPDWSELNYPNDQWDDAQVLASAGWGTDEDYGSASDML
tara:strand:+ start:93 stop:518 length:426 start_codon:yes stop_codon:yes gene_type:complete